MTAEPLDLDALEAQYNNGACSDPWFRALVAESRATRAKYEAAAEGHAWWMDMAGQHSRRAERAEAAIARVEALCDNQWAHGERVVMVDDVRAALRGDQ